MYKRSSCFACICLYHESGDDLMHNALLSFPKLSEGSLVAALCREDNGALVPSICNPE